MHEWEVWRSPFGFVQGVALDPGDSSVWATIGDSVYHYGPDHTLLSRTELWLPASACVDPRDGSCWVADWAANLGDLANEAVLVHLGADGVEMDRVLGYRVPALAARAGPDGSFWLADVHGGDHLIRVSSSGEEVARVDGLTIAGLAVNTADGTCWALDSYGKRLVHASVDGSLLWSGAFSLPDDLRHATYNIAPNGADGSVWVVDPVNDDLVHVAEGGGELSRTHFVGGLETVSLDLRDGTCWVGGVTEGMAHVSESGAVLGFVACPATVLDPGTGTFWSGGSSVWGWIIGGGLPDPLLHWDRDGRELWRTGGSLCGGAFVDSPGGSVWTRSDTRDLVRLAETGDELWRRPDFDPPYTSHGEGMNPADGSLYVVFAKEATLARISRDGSEEWVALNYTPNPVGSVNALGVAANPSDGSFWAFFSSVLDPGSGTYGPALLHLAADGSEMCRVPGARGGALAINASDGSVWAVQALPFRAAKYSSSGGLLWHQDVADTILSASVDPNDGSCWIGGNERVRHFGREGTLLLDLAAEGDGVAVDAHTGCCWATELAYVAVWDRSGRRLWKTDGFADTFTCRVEPRDGSLWVDSGGQWQLVHLWAPTTPFSDVLPGNWAGRAVRMCYEYGIVGGYPDGSYQPLWPVSRAQMAGFVSRALAGGDANVPPGPETPHFPDVATDYWAYKYIEYAYANNIVAGYPGGRYVPELAVDRGQMAAFIARAIVTPTGEAGLAGYTPPATPSFPDVPTDFWTYKHIEYIKSQGIVGGYPDGRYHPEGLCTRDQMAVFIARAFELLPY